MQTINQLHCILKQYAGYFFFLYSGSLSKYFVSVLILWLSCSRWIFTLGEQGKNRYLTSPFIISDFEYIFAGELHLILTDFFFSNFPYYDQDFFYLDNLENNNINSCPHFYFFFKSVSVCEIKRDVSILKAPMDPKQIIIFVLDCDKVEIQFPFHQYFASSKNIFVTLFLHYCKEALPFEK